MTSPASTATHYSLSQARAALTGLLQGAVMSKFVTHRECTAYRNGITDAIAAINAAPQVLSTQDSTRTGDDIGPCARHPTEKETGGSPAVAAPTPRTDAAVIHATFPDAEVVCAGFARQLERELDAIPSAIRRIDIIEECAEAVEGSLKERMPTDFYAAVIRKLKDRHE